MLSPIENSQNKLKSRQSLPRGYFKKRKPDRQLAFHAFPRTATWSSMLSLAVLVVLAAVASADSHATTIEPSLTVLSLEKPATSNATDLQEIEGVNNTNGICGNLDIRYSISNMRLLKGCRVVEGFVHILLIDEVEEEEFKQYRFPELVEITGYLLLYRLSGIRSLYHLFPNLAVIRGQEVYNEYALVIYEFKDLEEIGLVNLQTIQRGSVRIEKNDKLCYAEMIEWSLITGHSDHYIAKNRDNRFCPTCNKDLNCPKRKNDQRPLCWNQQHCQVKCTCGENACSPDGTCCDKSCVGGCKDGMPKRCTSCKQLSSFENGIVMCSEKCGPGKYEYLNRRCVTEQECIDFNKNIPVDMDRGIDHRKTYIPYNTTCRQGCPHEYVPFENHKTKKMDCRKCVGNECLMKCESKVIDSIATANSMKGCAIIEGPLEIQIRRTSKNLQYSKNIMRELEAALSEVVEIYDYLKVARTFPLYSLSFLKKLQVIRGRRLESNKFAMVIWDNQNLQELFHPDQEVQIPVGQFFFHYNPKLCFSNIEKIAKNNSLIENYNATRLSNGDKTQCNIQKLYVQKKSLHSSAVLLTWKSLDLHDERSLLSYVVYYTPAKYQNVTIWEGRDACGNDGWMLEDINDFVPKDQIAFPLTNLEPFTQYAFYVKAYTLSTEQNGAQSDIQYIRTQAGQPSSVVNVDVVVKNSSMISVTWEPPKKINGEISHYIVKIQMLANTEDNPRDFCQQPLELYETLAAPYRNEHPTKKPQGTSIFGQPAFPDYVPAQCDCKTCATTCKKPQKEEDDDRQAAIDFENQIQDLVYVRNIEPDIKKDRAKRELASNVNATGNDTISADNTIATLQSFRETNMTNEYGEYTQFVREIHDFSKLAIDIPNLRHFTQYSVGVRVCRKITADDYSPEGHLDLEKAEHCSIPTQTPITTAKKDDADDIKIFDVSNVPSNESYGIVRISWKAPENPNGVLLSYTIKYKKNEIDHATWDSICIPQQTYLNQTFYLLKPLSNGNYSIRIAASSYAGLGNLTAIKYIIISESSGAPLWVYLLSAAAFLALVSGSLFYYVRCHYMKSLKNMKLIANVNPDYAGVQYKADNWETPREKVTQMQELGQGSFGMVYEGIIRDLKIEGSETRCAIKTVNENATDKERISFLNEASVMKQFDTAFVVRLLGVVSQSQPTMVIMELMINGDLKGYLRSHRPEYDNGSGTAPIPPTLRQILQMAAEIADGMSYLAAKKFVHRDLAARNCMVAEDLTVKIGDFGMTRDIYETDYYRKGTKGLLPVRWMSPESLKDGVFTSSSDVFSYGVVLWEISTLASQPYQGLSNDQVLRYVIEGGVMERPENCPDKLYDLMRKCWQHRPSARPTFMGIVETLLVDVNQNFKNVAFHFSRDGQDILLQQRQGDYAVNIQDDVTTPLRHGEEETSSIEGNHFLLDEMNNSSKFHEL